MKEYIDLQIESNQSRNLFYKENYETMKFMDSTINVIQNIDRIAPHDLNETINYTTEKVLWEFCRVNQYYSFQENDRTSLREIYWDLYHNLVEKNKSVDIISQTHYANLSAWLERANPFSQKMYQMEEALLKPVACCEYTAVLQKAILHLKETQLLEPILDIGCGKEGNLVSHLRKNGFESYGIDRFSDDSPFLEKADWLNYEYGIERWGAIVSNLGFSNHFIHNHLREDGNYIEYARKYMEILKSLKIGGRFYYAPDLPFIEEYLDEQSFSIEWHNIENLSIKATVIKRLK